LKFDDGVITIESVPEVPVVVNVYVLSFIKSPITSSVHNVVEFLLTVILQAVASSTLTIILTYLPSLIETV
jgi:hypothetical protein